MATRAHGRNEPLPRPIIVKKIVASAHGGHHGGAWKVAYADFVTAMMAFFLLLWLLGMTDEQKRKGIADYFTPTLVQLRQNSAGANGVLGGDSLIADDNYAHRARQTGQRAIVVPRAAIGGPESGDADTRDRARFEALKRRLDTRMASDPELRALRRNVRLVETREGLRIDLVDEADFSMFALSTDTLLPRARRLIGEVARVISGVPNAIIVRGHTDALPYASGRTMNNGMLSTARAEATRAALGQAGIGSERLARIEGVADREPFVPGDRYDPRNRRMSVILAWRGGEAGSAMTREGRR